MYAENTAPHDMIVTQSNIPEAGSGVFTTATMLPKNVRLGPYKGEVVKLKYEDRIHAAGYAWQVRIFFVPKSISFKHG